MLIQNVVDRVSQTHEVNASFVREVLLDRELDRLVRFALILQDQLDLLGFREM